MAKSPPLGPRFNWCRCYQPNMRWEGLAPCTRGLCQVNWGTVRWSVFLVAKGTVKLRACQLDRVRQCLSLPAFHTYAIKAYGPGATSLGAKIADRARHVWRGEQVIDVLVQSRRDGNAATRFFKKLRRKAGKVPRLVMTDKLASYVKPCAQLLPTSEHVNDKGQNNRAENSHQPTRQRERRMRKFKSVALAQKFLSIYSQMCNFFGLVRHTLSASNHRDLFASRLDEWRLLALPATLS